MKNIFKNLVYENLNSFFKLWLWEEKNVTKILGKKKDKKGGKNIKKEST